LSVFVSAIWRILVFADLTRSPNLLPLGLLDFSGSGVTFAMSLVDGGVTTLSLSNGAATSFGKSEKMKFVQKKLFSH